jgi:hypothetical protein
LEIACNANAFLVESVASTERIILTIFCGSAWSAHHKLHFFHFLNAISLVVKDQIAIAIAHKALWRVSVRARCIQWTRTVGASVSNGA